jgi:hypothetical protein
VANRITFASFTLFCVAQNKRRQLAAGQLPAKLFFDFVSSVNRLRVDGKPPGFIFLRIWR